jgi:hypothetical protein
VPLCVWTHNLRAIASLCVNDSNRHACMFRGLHPCRTIGPWLGCTRQHKSCDSHIVTQQRLVLQEKVKVWDAPTQAWSHKEDRRSTGAMRSLRQTPRGGSHCLAVGAVPLPGQEMCLNFSMPDIANPPEIVACMQQNVRVEALCCWTTTP